MTTVDRSPFEDVPLLRGLGPEARRLVAAGFEPVRFAFGEVIVCHGDPADALYVLTAGQARVLAVAQDGSEVTLRVLGPGDSFGADGLARTATRSATVRASGDVAGGRLDAAVFRALAAAHPTVATEVELAVRRHELGDFLHLRSELGDLPADVLDALLNGLMRATVRAGAVVIRQGEPVGPLYFVLDGRLRVTRDGHDTGALGPGDHFGERSLFTGEPRSAGVHAATDCRLLYLPPETYRALLAAHPTFRDRIARRVAQYDYRDRARVAPDVDEELLPADAAARDPVGEDQVDVVAAEHGTPRRRPWRPPRAVPFVGAEGGDGAGACLTMIARYHGLDADGPPGEDDVVAAAAELGLAARRIDVGDDDLDELALPAMAGWDGDRWVVVDAVDRAGVRVTDPASGRERHSRREFARRCSGTVLLLAAAGSAESGAETAPGPFATDDGRFVKRPGRPRRVPMVWQVDEADCGAACLAMVTRCHGRAVSLAQVRETARTGVEGTTLSGLVVQFVGDAVMAIWGAPVRQPDHAVRAARAGIALHRAVAQVAASRPGWPRFRVGINTGPALVGNIGGAQMRNYTAIGDTTNLAARLEALAEPGQVVIGPVTRTQLGARARVESRGAVPVKGKREPVPVAVLHALEEP